MTMHDRQPPVIGHDGPDLSPADHRRLNRQVDRVLSVLVSASETGNPWCRLVDIAAVTGISEASVSARLRDLRKPRFGGHTIPREHDASGSVFWYRLGESNA